MNIEVIRDTNDNIVNLVKIPAIDGVDIYDLFKASNPTSRYTKVQVNKNNTTAMSAFEGLEKEHMKFIVSDIKLLLRFLAVLSS
jgi:hypothetical protein